MQKLKQDFMGVPPYDNPKPGEEEMGIFDGMRFWALVWISLGNTYLFATYFVVGNTKDYPEFY